MQLRQDTLLWTRDVYESVARQKGHKGSGGPDSPPRNAKAKGRQPPWSPAQPQWNKPKGTPKGEKSKGIMGAGKGKDSDWPASWAKISPEGAQYGRDHFIKKCPGNGGRSHNCPVLKNGWVSNAPPSKHSPKQCPHRWLLVEPVASGTELPSRLTGETSPSNPTTTMTAEGLPSHGPHDATTPHPQSKAAVHGYHRSHTSSLGPHNPLLCCRVGTSCSYIPAPETGEPWMISSHNNSKTWAGGSLL